MNNDHIYQGVWETLRPTQMTVKQSALAALSDCIETSAKFLNLFILLIGN